ncbi:MAG TPA: hypothetical protein VJJ46_07850, partial [Anaerolineales bacterium]|nr:hypothetical protein [Anaerolineales bacterium]
QFLMVTEQVASFYPLESSASPPSLRAALLLLIPSGALVIFILSAPTAMRQLAGRRLGRRPALGRASATNTRN